MHKKVGRRDLIQSDKNIEQKRFATVVAHRRFGKTLFGANHCILDSFSIDLEGREHAKPRYGLIYPERKQGKKNVWKPLKHFGEDYPGFDKNESDLYIEFESTGARIMIEGADNPDRIRGEYFDGVFIDEFAQISPYLWNEVILPTLSDYRGWAIISGTPKGQNHFLDKLNDSCESDNWLSAVFPASEELAKEFSIKNEPDILEATKVFSQQQLDFIKEEMENDDDIEDTDAAFKQEYGCQFKQALSGTYYGKKINRARKQERITNVPYESKKPVITSWDLGVGDEMAIWFAQFIGKEIRLIDYYENNSEGLPFYFDYCRQKPYSYSDHLAPWDIEVRELSSGRTRKEIAKDHGFHFRVVEKHDIEDRIAAVRSILSQCWFDRENCKKGVKALEEYRKEFDEDTKTFKKKPLHNWASNGSDSFGYLAMGMNKVTSRNDNFEKSENYTADTGFEVFS